MHLAAVPSLRWLSDAFELRRLKRRLPHVHRAWSRASRKLRPESDAEYLTRLRALAHERDNEKFATMPTAGSDPLGRIVDDLRDALEAAEELNPAMVEPAIIEGATHQARLLLTRLTQSQRRSDK